MNDISWQFFTLPSEHWQHALALRMAIFVDEMGVPTELESDDYDQMATHLIASTDDITIATLRLLITGHKAKVGRVAVHPDYRRQGIGKHIMLAAIEHCQQHGVKRIELGSQSYITDFYRRLGFQQEGELFMDAGIPHQFMYMKLDNA